MNESQTSSSTDEPFTQLLSGSSAEVRDLATRARAFIKTVHPDAVEEVDPADRLDQPEVRALIRAAAARTPR